MIAARSMAPIARDEYLSFRLGAEEYAIDILRVQEIGVHETVKRLTDVPAFVRGVIELRGRTLPIVDMRLKLGLPAADGKEPVIVVLDIAGTGLGIAVDAVSDVVALAAVQVRPAPALDAGLASGFIRGLAPVDGRMLIVIDVVRLLSDLLAASAEDPGRLPGRG